MTLYRVNQYYRESSLLSMRQQIPSIEEAMRCVLSLKPTSYKNGRWYYKTKSGMYYAEIEEYEDTFMDQYSKEEARGMLNANL